MEPAGGHRLQRLSLRLPPKILAHSYYRRRRSPSAPTAACRGLPPYIALSITPKSPQSCATLQYFAPGGQKGSERRVADISLHPSCSGRKPSLFGGPKFAARFREIERFRRETGL
jgi:hypothetical protein